MFNGVFFKIFATLGVVVPIPDTLLKKGDIGGWFASTDHQDIINFYHAWQSAGILKLTIFGVLKVFGGSAEWIAKLLYRLSSSMQTVFNKIFDLVDLLKISKMGTDTPLGKIRLVIFGIAMALLLISLLWAAFNYITGKNELGHELVTNILLGMLTIVLIPSLVSWGGEVTKSATSDINGAGTQNATMAIEPFQSNTLDMLQVANAGFNMDPNNIGGKKGWADYNAITDKNLMQTDFTMPVGNDLIKALDDSKNGQAFAFTTNGVLNNTKTGVKEGIMSVKIPDTSINFGNAMSSVYPRYHVNWLALDIEEIMIFLMLAVLAIKLGTSVLLLIWQTVISPLMVTSHASDRKHIRTMIMDMYHTFIGIASDLVMLHVSMIILTWLPQSSFVKGMNPFTKVLGYTIVLYALLQGVLKGAQTVERWLGVDSGVGSVTKGALQSLQTVGSGVANMTGAVMNKLKQREDPDPDPDDDPKGDNGDGDNPKEQSTAEESQDRSKDVDEDALSKGTADDSNDDDDQSEDQDDDKTDSDDSNGQNDENADDPNAEPGDEDSEEPDNAAADQEDRQDLADELDNPDNAENPDSTDPNGADFDGLNDDSNDGTGNNANAALNTEQNTTTPNISGGGSNVTSPEGPVNAARQVEDSHQVNPTTTVPSGPTPDVSTYTSSQGTTPTVNTPDTSVSPSDPITSPAPDVTNSPNPDSGVTPETKEAPLKGESLPNMNDDGFDDM